MSCSVENEKKSDVLLRKLLMVSGSVNTEIKREKTPEKKYDDKGTHEGNHEGKSEGTHEGNHGGTHVGTGETIKGKPKHADEETERQKMKKAIGTYARTHSIGATIEHFQGQWPFLSHCTIQRYKKKLEKSSDFSNKSRKLQKYTKKVRNEIGKHACRYGTSEALKKYGKKHGKYPTLQWLTVQGFQFEYQNDGLDVYTADEKYELAQHAVENGVEKTREEFKSKLPLLTDELVKTFIKEFKKKEKKKETLAKITSQKRFEIGSYASVFNAKKAYHKYKNEHAGLTLKIVNEFRNNYVSMYGKSMDNCDFNSNAIRGDKGRFCSDFNDELKHEIGKFASENGVNETLEKYKEKAPSMSRKIIRKFCKKYESEKSESDEENVTESDEGSDTDEESDTDAKSDKENDVNERNLVDEANIVLTGPSNIHEKEKAVLMGDLEERIKLVDDDLKERTGNNDPGKNNNDPDKINNCTKNMLNNRHELWRTDAGSFFAPCSRVLMDATSNIEIELVTLKEFDRDDCEAMLKDVGTSNKKFMYVHMLRGDDGADVCGELKPVQFENDAVPVEKLYNCVGEKCPERLHVDPFTCHVCEKSFRYKSVLAIHEETHRKMKKYRCDCGRTFKQRYSLATHQAYNVCNKSDKKRKPKEK